jgi:hypothetical protein
MRSSVEIKWTHAKRANVGYVAFPFTGNYARTESFETYAGTLNIDTAEDGTLLGIEIVDTRQAFPLL